MSGSGEGRTDEARRLRSLLTNPRGRDEIERDLDRAARLVEEGSDVCDILHLLAMDVEPLLYAVDDRDRLRDTLTTYKAEARGALALRDQYAADLAAARAENERLAERLKIAEAVNAGCKSVHDEDKAALAETQAKIRAVEALYGGEPPTAWIAGTKIVRASRYDERLRCERTESLLRLEDVRAALAAGVPVPTNQDEGR